MGLSQSRGLGRWGALLALLVPLGASGCSPGTVTGTVSYNGKMLRGGNVTFISTAGKRSATASIQEDGTYRLDKVPPGEVTVCVETASLKPAEGATARHYKAPPGMQAPGGLDEDPASKHYTPIPEKYSKPEESGITYTVKGGSQTFDIKLPP